MHEHVWCTPYCGHYIWLSKRNLQPVYTTHRPSHINPPATPWVQNLQVYVRIYIYIYVYKNICVWVYTSRVVHSFDHLFPPFSECPCSHMFMYVYIHTYIYICILYTYLFCVHIYVHVYRQTIWTYVVPTILSSGVKFRRTESCMCVYIMCIYIHIYIVASYAENGHLWWLIDLYIHLHVYSYVCICYVIVCANICIYVYMYICIYIYMYICILV